MGYIGGLAVLLPGDTTVNSVKLKGAPSDDVALRLSVSAFLERTDYTVNEISPSSILIVRKLEDPMPGVVGMRRPHYSQHYAWERALKNKLNDIARQAVRPHAGRLDVSADTLAVVFIDRAEMLSCFAYELSTGVAAQHWWWYSLLRQFPYPLSRSDQLVRLFAQEIQLLPAVLMHLYTWHRVAELVQKITPNHLVELARILAAEYGLDYLQQGLVLEGGGRGDAEQQTDSPAPFSENEVWEAYEDKEANASYSNSSEQREESIWQVLIPDVHLPAQLSPLQRNFLHLTMSLHRIPWRCRDITIQKAMVLAMQKAHDIDKTSCPPQAKRLSVERKATVPLMDSGKRRVTKESGQDIAPWEPAPSKSKRDISLLLGQGKEESEQADAKSLDHVAPTSPDARDETVIPATSQATQDTPDQRQTNTPDYLPQAGEYAWAEEGVPTELGGVLYLINLMQAMAMPYCLEERSVLSELSPWALLELLGRGLLHVSGEEIKADSIWTILAQLDGRNEDEPVGHYVHPCQDFLLPTNILDYALPLQPESPMHYANKGGRLRLWCNDGLLLADQTVEPTLSGKQQAQAILRELGLDGHGPLLHKAYDKAPVDIMSLHVLNTDNPAIQNGVACLLPTIRFILHSHYQGFDSAHLHCRGQLYVSETHIDFRTYLDNISIEARRAGLDQDPGWLVDYGKVVKFHYE